MNTITKSRDTHLAYLKAICATQGPEPEAYDRLLSWYNEMAAEIKDGRWTPSEVAEARALVGPAYLTPETLQGFCFVKPHGYAGDFEIIEKIYANHVSPKPEFRKWDLFFQAQAAPKAVRNRKTYFKQILQEKCAQGPISILNLASGPCRGLAEFLETFPDASFTMDCLDLDANAIAYAQSLLPDAPQAQITFQQKNILRFRPEKSYDLIWSAGLFDYFEAPVFIRLLGRFLRYLAPEGEMIIGNFHPRNPSRNYMEVFGEWFLHHRTEEEMISLAVAAGVGQTDRLQVEQEAEGVNLFLRVKA